MRTYVHYIPLITTIVAIAFGVVLYRHWRRKPSALYLAWWWLGVVMYGVGTFTEGLTTLLGWNEVIFKSWYISGALLGGAPLAQGTVYLLMSNRVAHRLAALLVSVIAIAALFVVLSPINYASVEMYRLSGKALEWTWVRFMSPFINLYAVVFLIGGAFWSAVKYWRASPTLRRRAWGNILIAIGAILPGIGGSSARAGLVEVLYITELLGLLTIWCGYAVIVHDSTQSVHTKQQILRVDCQTLETVPVHAVDAPADAGSGIRPSTSTD